MFKEKEINEEWFDKNFDEKRRELFCTLKCAKLKHFQMTFRSDNSTKWSHKKFDAYVKEYDLSFMDVGLIAHFMNEAGVSQRFVWEILEKYSTSYPLEDLKLENKIMVKSELTPEDFIETQHKALKETTSMSDKEIASFIFNNFICLEATKWTPTYVYNLIRKVNYY